MTTYVHDFSTTYLYEPLQGRRQIRLLEITTREADTPTYSLLVTELSSNNDDEISFEAVSYVKEAVQSACAMLISIRYQWGARDRVSHLSVLNSASSIGLTANLTEALPFLTQNSQTKRLWIDQICINQADHAEKSVQVGLMSEIYKKATRVIIWLGAENESSQLCRKWLDDIAQLIPTMNSANKIMTSSPDFSPRWRLMALRGTFHSPGTDPKWAAAIWPFFNRHWFRRGWIVQEFLLAKDIICLTGRVKFNLQDLHDLYTVPSDPERIKSMEGWLNYSILMSLKADLFVSTPQPLKFLRVMASVAEEFTTQELGDRLYGFLGLMEGLNFVPDYRKSVKHNFTLFAATLARDYGSIDFLSLWSANLDARLDDTPNELLGLPSWVPSYSASPLCTPYRLAIGGCRANKIIAWNAAAGRRHMHDQASDATTTGRLYVRGKIIDRIDTRSSACFAEYWGAEEAYLTSLVNQIKTDLAGFEHWTQLEMIHFLNIVSSSGMPPYETAEEILGLAPSILPDEHKHMIKHYNTLGLCLFTARGRRFAVTEKGRKGLVPFVGSRVKEEGRLGSAIAVLHGCIVPIVLESLGEEESDGGKWTVVGDCYVEGVMNGEAVDWNEEDARTFILV